MASEVRKIGGWRSQDFGLPPGTRIETRVEEVTTDKGAR